MTGKADQKIGRFRIDFQNPKFTIADAARNGSAKPRLYAFQHAVQVLGNTFSKGRHIQQDKSLNDA